MIKIDIPDRIDNGKLMSLLKGTSLPPFTLEDVKHFQNMAKQFRGQKNDMHWLVYEIIAARATRSIAQRTGKDNFSVANSYNRAAKAALSIGNPEIAFHCAYRAALVYRKVINYNDTRGIEFEAEGAEDDFDYAFDRLHKAMKSFTRNTPLSDHKWFPR